MAGLGRTVSSLPYQFHKAFRFHRTFAICLSSSATSDGVIFFGDSPYNFLPDEEISKSLIYTPLIENPHATAAANIVTSAEYGFYLLLYFFKRLIFIHGLQMSLDA